MTCSTHYENLPTLECSEDHKWAFKLKSILHLHHEIIHYLTHSFTFQKNLSYVPKFIILQKRLPMNYSNKKITMLHISHLLVSEIVTSNDKDTWVFKISDKPNIKLHPFLA